MQKPLLLTLEYLPQHGGIAKYLESEVKHFNGDVAVVKAQNYLMPLWPQWLPLIWKAKSMFDKSQCDGLWVSHILPIGYIALMWKWTFKTPYRVYLHGLDLVRPRKSLWKRFWVKKILQNADEVIVNSKATAELLCHYELDSSIARVQYPRIKSIEIEKYRSLGKELRQKHGIDDKPILLTISRLVKRKGIDLVIRALPMVWKQIPDLVYVVVGDGEEIDNLRLLSKDQNNVIFTGSVSEDEKYSWLSACDVFILTPRDDEDDFEGYGIVYKEAQIFGKPVIGSKVGGVPEAVGDKGMLIGPSNVDALSKAILTKIKGDHP
ncbi:hypothetical protein CL632_00765 [bacterium]|nr:hypothetical protein [bacterium]MDP6571480.1 glycosyltransferase family 4 protein [Patescibacteria group bacterium]MDP6756179.1 glycosyltransferase family 4 protein [Patescibacteria group bacterium]|tara:strand:- start:46240 stop:47202 length:963 start_codon:yes stop_codon:yes gene_type:complete